MKKRKGLRKPSVRAHRKLEKYLMQQTGRPSHEKKSGGYSVRRKRTKQGGEFRIKEGKVVRQE